MTCKHRAGTRSNYLRPREAAAAPPAPPAQPLIRHRTAHGLTANASRWPRPSTPHPPPIPHPHSPSSPAATSYSHTRTVARRLHLEQQDGNGRHMAHVPSNPKDIHGAQPPALVPTLGSRGGALRRDGAAVAATPAKIRVGGGRGVEGEHQACGRGREGKRRSRGRGRGKDATRPTDGGERR